MSGLGRWERVLVGGLVAKAALGVVVYLVAIFVDAGGLSPRTHLMVAHVLAYGAVGLFLIWRGDRDRRAVLWGVILMMVASMFVDGTLQGVSHSSDRALPAFGVAHLLQFNALAPYFLWRLVTEFPRVSWFGTRALVLKTFVRVSLVLGMALFTVNLVGVFLAGPTRPESLLESPLWPLLRANNAYWGLIFSMSLPAAAVLLMKLPAARESERRRAWLLVLGFVCGTLPTMLWVMAITFWPPVLDTLPLSIAGWVIYPALLSPPFTTAYAVVVHQALDVRLVARVALRYSMARYTLAALALLPSGVLMVSVYRDRSRSLGDFVSDVRNVVLLVVASAALLAIRLRRTVLEHVDRLFFPEVYEAHRVLEELIDQCRVAPGPAGLASTLTEGLTKAFRPETVHIMFASDGLYFSPEGSHRALPEGSPILTLLAQEGGSLRVHLSRIGSRVRELPEEDRFWLADGGVRFLMGIRDPDGRTVGLMALGEKSSELPYTREDRQHLEVVATTAALALSYMELYGGPSTSRISQPEMVQPGEVARECVHCATLTASETATCDSCGAGTTVAPVPLILANKFRIAERLGAGAMGVVYRAVDLNLGRSVAIKTLPRTSPGHAARLRQEARAMASVSHPNLALIFGGESWRGLPMLVVEYLGGGTLADRLREGPLSSRQTRELGQALTGAVEAIHRAGILHRDIKPSNIGFAEDGTPKLLDFGLAHILGGAQDQDGGPIADMHGAPFRAPHSGDAPNDTTLADGQVVGTPIYLSPEAIQGGRPNPQNDLWALAVTLYQAAAGVNPFVQNSLALTIIQIVQEGAPDLREIVPTADLELADFLRRALSLDRGKRPRTAKEFSEWLAGLRSAEAA